MIRDPREILDAGSVGTLWLYNVNQEHVWND
jgi:hypothetical protein